MDQEDADDDGIGDVCDDENPVVSVFLKPYETIIPRGGKLRFKATVSNNTNKSGFVYFATKVKLPNGNIYPPTGYLFGPLKVPLAPHQSKSGNLSQPIPINAPLSPPSYTYYGYVAKPGVGIIDQDQFEFEVIPPSAEVAGPEDWETTVDEEFFE